MADAFGFSEPEAAAQIGVSARTLRRWRQDGKVGYLLTPGNRVRYHGEHLRRLLLDMRVEPARGRPVATFGHILPAN